MMRATGRLQNYEHIKDDTPIDLYQIEMLHRLQTEGSMSFENIFKSKTSKLAMVGLFLAMLELMKKQNTVRWDETMTGDQQNQFNSGEKRPDYTGTVLPGTPRVQTRAMGGMIEGPGTGTSDSIPATIYQNGGPVQEARLSDGEFVMTADAVRGAGGGDRDAGAAKMYRMMNQLEGVA